MEARSEEEIVRGVVSSNAGRNKITIGCQDIIELASLELGRALDASELCDALKEFVSGEAGGDAEAIVDAGTYICHQSADRVFGECLDAESDEWSEVDIDTDWVDFDSGTPSDVHVIVRPS